MAKPERQPWPYNTQWNHYPSHHHLNYPKLPPAYPGPQAPPGGLHHHSTQHYPLSAGSGPAELSSTTASAYLPGIRVPEPRRPYQVPYSYDTYCQQESYSIHGSYPQHNSYYPKQYVHRPIPQEHPNPSSNHFKVSNNIPSYSGYSENYPETKDRSNPYAPTWKSTSQNKKKTGDLDVRKFLATWQEKDDDLPEISPGTDVTKHSQFVESTPLDCSKRNVEKPPKRIYDGFNLSHSSNPTGCVVQPYCIKGDSIPLNRNIIHNEGMNANIYQTNANHSYHSKNYYSQQDYWKQNSNKLSCEYNAPYSQHYNCDLNLSSLSYARPKENIIEVNERSQYNLTSSLETGDLFCDINPPVKPQMFHPLYTDGQTRSYNDQQYYSNYPNDFSQNYTYNKESRDTFSSNLKYKDSFRKPEKYKSIHPQSDHFVNGSNPTSAIAYEGAFNILPNPSDPTPMSLYHPTYPDGTTNGFPVKPVDSAAASHPVQPLVKSNLGTGKVKPFNFNDEISSDDIDITIASSGDLESVAPSSQSVISFSRTKRSAVENYDPKSQPSSVIIENTNPLVESSINELNGHDRNVESSKTVPDFPLVKSHSVPEVVSFNEKANIDYLDISHNYFNGSASLDDVKSCNEKKEEEINSGRNSPCSGEEVFDSNDNLLLLARCSQEYGCPLSDNRKEIKSNNNDDLPGNIDEKLSNRELMERDEETLAAVCRDIENRSPASRLLQSSPPLSPEARKPDNPTTTSLGKSLPIIDDIPDFPVVSTENDDLSSIPQRSVENISENVQNSEAVFESGKDDLPSLDLHENELKSDHCDLIIEESNTHISPVVNSLITESIPLGFCTNKMLESELSENALKAARETVIKCSLRWDKIFTEDSLQRDVSLDLGPAKVQLKLPTENFPASQWKIIEAENKIKTSSIVQVKRLILKRKSQIEERIPKVIIRKTEGQKYRSFLKNESKEAVLTSGKLKIIYDIPEKQVSPERDVSSI